MEAEPLNGPHPRLEACVTALIPPAAREAVAGDLFEQYRSPAQYVGAALRALPFVIASQIRRRANIPALVMQSLMVAACIGGLMLSLQQPVEFTSVALATAAIVSTMLISEVYGDGQISEKRAIFEAIVFAIAVLVFAFYVLIVLLHGNRLYTHLLSWSFFFWLILPFGMPALCALRALALLCRENTEPWDEEGVSHAELVHHYERLEASARMQSRRDIALLVITGLLSALAFWLAGLKVSLAGSLAATIYAVAPFYLLLYGAPRSLSVRLDFLSLRETFRQEVITQHRLRAFVAWLRLVPLLLLLYSVAFHFSAGPTQRLWLVYATMAAMFGAFLVLTMNRDQGARLQLMADRLDRLRERPSG